MDFKATESKYRPQPVWLWNSKLNIGDTNRMADNINSAGFGGFAIGPYCGLNNAYLSDEWFRNISAALKSAADNSMECWICDEMPGFSDYSVTAIDSQGLEFQQKFLRLESGEKTNERTIIFSDGCHFYYDVNPFCIDVFNEATAPMFINEAYLPYLTKTTESFNGFVLNTSPYFTEDIPWSFTLPAEYKSAYGEELLDVLIELFKPVGNYKQTRYKFWRLICDLFETKFLKPTYDWCIENGFQLSVICPRGTTFKSFINAGIMTKYKYSHIPCVTADSPADVSPSNALMASSAAQQLKKEQSAAILYNYCGHGRTFEELKHMAQQYLVRGINKVIVSSVAYSMEGFRKNTVSSPFICLNSRNEENQYFNNYVSTVSKLLTEGDADFETLLIHNQTCALSSFDSLSNDEDILLDELEDVIEALEKKHIPFHIGDEILLESHGSTDGNTLIVGDRKYKTVVLTNNPVLSESTTKLLSEFEYGGGLIVMADSLKENDICDNENLLYTTRKFPEFRIHYFVNNSSECFTSSVTQGSKMLDVSTGELVPFYGIYKFSAYESIIVIDDGTPQQSRPYIKPLKELDISGKWDIEQSSINTFVIDKCDVYIDDVLTYKDMDSNSITEFLCKNGNALNIRCDYKFNFSQTGTELYLLSQHNDLTGITLNGSPIGMIFEEPCENDLFLKVNISQYLTEGENVLSVSAVYSNTDKYQILYEKASAYETELKKINYEKDFSPVILAGDFSVVCDGNFVSLDGNATRYTGDFRIDRKSVDCDIYDITKHGYPFFAGTITLKRTFNLSDTSYCIRFISKSTRSVSVDVNDKRVNTLFSSPYEYDISNELVKGNNEIKITLTGNMRNLFGPHHLPEGELCKVVPGNYYRYPSVWNRNTEIPWDDNYCFTEFGIEMTE